MIEETEKINQRQKLRLYEKAKKHFRGDLKGKSFAIWGLAFKPKTDDMREAPSIDLIRKFLDEGVHVHVNDPVALESCRELFGDRLTYHEDCYDCANKMDALFVLTEWNDYRKPDFEKLKTILNNPVVFDGRNIYSPKTLSSFGFTHYTIGRS